MIPAQNIVAWGNVVPWADQRQVEQDLIISRARVGSPVDHRRVAHCTPVPAVDVRT